VDAGTAEPQRGTVRIGAARHHRPEERSPESEAGGVRRHAPLPVGSVKFGQPPHRPSRACKGAPTGPFGVPFAPLYPLETSLDGTCLVEYDVIGHILTPAPVPCPEYRHALHSVGHRQNKHSPRTAAGQSGPTRRGRFLLKEPASASRSTRPGDRQDQRLAATGRPDSPEDREPRVDLDDPLLPTILDSLTIAFFQLLLQLFDAVA